MRYLPHAAASSEPNVIVDGTANDRTLITLSHWRRSGTPADLMADTSTGIVFNYLDRPDLHVPADVVSNNHFDEDGPEPPQRRRDAAGVVVRVRQSPNVGVVAVAHHQRHAAVCKYDRRRREDDQHQDGDKEWPHGSHCAHLPTASSRPAVLSVNRGPLIGPDAAPTSACQASAWRPSTRPYTG